MKNILYIDDDINSLKLIKEQIKFINSDFNVITENNSENAISLFKNKSNILDIIFIDIQLPNINGYDLLLIIKKIKPRIPVIMVTANNGNREYDYVIKKLGASEYIIKPLSLSTLKDILYRYVL